MKTFPFKRGDVYLVELPLPDKVGHTLREVCCKSPGRKDHCSLPHLCLCHHHYL